MVARLIRVRASDVQYYPRQSAFKKDKRVAGMGVTIGLAWTPLAGTRSAWSQAAIMNMRGFKLAGQLGEVMRGSAEIAYRSVIGNAAGFGIEKNFFEDAFVPRRAPRPGTALARASPRRTRCCRWNANAGSRAESRWRGELTLTGHVLPVGGIARRSSPRGARVVRSRSCQRTIAATLTHCPNTSTRALTRGTRYTIDSSEVAPALPLSDNDGRPRSS